MPPPPGKPRKPKAVKVTPAVVKGIKSGQVPKQTLAMKQGPTKSRGYVTKAKLQKAKPKPKAKSGFIAYDEGPGKPAVFARQRPGNTMSYSTWRNNGDGTLSVNSEWGQRRKRPGDSSQTIIVKAKSTNAKNTGGLAKRSAPKRKAK